MLSRSSKVNDLIKYANVMSPTQKPKRTKRFRDFQEGEQEHVDVLQGW